MACSIGAGAVWIQSGLVSSGLKVPKGCLALGGGCETAGEIVESSGLVYLDEPHIADWRGRWANRSNSGPSWSGDDGQSAAVRAA